MSTQHLGTDTPPLYLRSYSSVGSSTSDGFEHQGDEAAPRYSAVFALHGRPVHSHRSRPLETEHDFSLQVGGIPWVKLFFLSRASSPLRTPKYEGGDKISGSIVLDLASPTNVSSITISIRGSIITSGTEEGTHPFLNKSHTIWSKAFGNPRYASATQNVRHRGNLDPGEYTWPFAITIPTSFEYSPEPGARALSFQTFESFLERDIPVTVQYDIILTIGRGSMRPDKSIIVPFNYTPNIVPEAPSPLRELSYQHARPLMGPLEDFDGWTTLPAASISPRLLGSRQPVEVECQLSLATPLCYARGTVIPCHLRLHCADSAVLDALSAPEAIRVTLQRRVKFYHRGLRGKPTTQTSTAQSAVWWASAVDGPPGTSEVRTIEGEIHLPRSLQSSSDFTFFTVEYTINFSSFDSPAIEPASNGKKTLLTQPITIGTFPAAGPRMREYSTNLHDQDAAP
ncbi:hypothetical protein H0H92_002717 [Tricholoma furcatifolium]|nr:hypothetical protein H0H92_002717 [Tricholoma furcatifolium]